MMFKTNNPVADAENYYNYLDERDEQIKQELGHGFYNKRWGDFVPMDEAYDYALAHTDFDEGESEEDFTEEQIINNYFCPRFIISRWERI